MADSPSPYAPGIIGDEAASPRPAGRAVVFLVATFVLTVVSSVVWQLWFPRSAIITGHSSAMQIVSILIGITGALTLLWAYLADAVPLWGTRREGYLMLAALVMAGVWIALAIANEHQVTWLATVVPFSVATSFWRATVAGGLTEIGQRRATTGRIAAAFVALTQIAWLASTPLSLAPLALGGGVAAGLSLALVVLTAVLSDDEAPPPSPASPVSVGRFLISRPLWASVPLLVCVGVSTLPRSLTMLALRETFGDDAFTLFPQWEAPVASIAAAAVYLAACRRAPFATLLRLALLAKAIGFAICALAWRGTAAGTLEAAMAARAVGDGFALIAILDLAMRLAPRGREAFGAILVSGVPNVLSLFVEPVVMNARVTTVAWFATAAAVMAAIAVSLLPRAIADPHDGRVLGSPS